MPLLCNYACYAYVNITFDVVNKIQMSGKTNKMCEIQTLVFLACVLNCVAINIPKVYIICGRYDHRAC